jgi:hypothetical protein
MITFVALALATQSPETPAPPTVRRPAIRAVIDIPDEIAPAVLPYAKCQMAFWGIANRGPYDPPVPPVARPDNCEKERTTAATEAESLLKEAGQLNADERKVFIERTLVSIETFMKESAPKPIQDKTDAAN